MEYYSVAHSGVRQESSTIIYQQNPINMICQQGPNSHISIAKSEAIQIGHGNVMSRQTACGEPGKRRVLAEAGAERGLGPPRRKQLLHLLRHGLGHGLSQSETHGPHLTCTPTNLTPSQREQTLLD